MPLPVWNYSATHSSNDNRQQRTAMLFGTHSGKASMATWMRDPGTLRLTGMGLHRQVNPGVTDEDTSVSHNYAANGATSTRPHFVVPFGLRRHFRKSGAFTLKRARVMVRILCDHLSTLQSSTAWEHSAHIERPSLRRSTPLLQARWVWLEGLPVLR